MVHGGVTEEGNRRDFLGQEFFFYSAHLARETYHPDGFSAASREKPGMTSGPIRMTKLWRFKYFTFRRREFYSLGLNYGLDELSVMNVCILDRDLPAGVAATVRLRVRSRV